jgi:rod shape-determining protein MreB
LHQLIVLPTDRLPTKRARARAKHQNNVPPEHQEGRPTLSRDLAIDLGTANTLVYAKGRGIVLNEPTVIALDSRTNTVLNMGREAWQMIGRTPGYIVAVRPLRKGAITDFDITQRMIELLLKRAGISRFGRPRVLICVPSAITAVERRAVEEAARAAGANSVSLIEQPTAAAIGAGLPIHQPLGNMVCDIGGGTTETAVISLGGVVALEAIRVGSFDIDATIQAYVRREYGIAIGERTAEEIKVAIGSAWPMDDAVKAEVRGRDLMSGLPKTVILAPEEVREAIEEQVGAIVDAVLRCLGSAPPELSQDLLTQGLHLVGGGGMLKGLDRRLSEETGLPVKLVEAPLECVVMGAGKCIEDFDAVHDLLLS